MNDNRTTIADIISLKTWVSSGAISNQGTMQDQEEKRAFYPKYAMTFTGATVCRDIAAKKVRKYKPRTDGTAGYDYEDMQTWPRVQKTVTFKVDSSKVPPIDPATNRPTVHFPNKFLAAFEAATFYENGDVLVSTPVNIAADEAPGGNAQNKPPLSVTFTVELYRGEDHKVYMLQRAYWSDGYLGTYCCG